MAEMRWIEKALVNSRAYNYFFRHTFLKWFLDFCRLGGNCLEFGCGAGFTGREISRRFRVKLTSTDYDAMQVAKARKLLEGSDVLVMQADATALPFKEGSFDCVVESNALHHIAGYRKALSEAFRVLRSGGHFYIMDEGKGFMWPLTLLLPFDPFDAKFTKESLMDDLGKAGFEIIKDRGKDVFMIEARKR
ncbi:MAG: class I SAM-dependent methyltransferase [Candidatus Micrarchaeota archaeon]